MPTSVSATKTSSSKVMRQVVSHGVVAVACVYIGFLYQDSGVINSASAVHQTDAAVKPSLFDSSQILDSDSLDSKPVEPSAVTVPNGVQQVDTLQDEDENQDTSEELPTTDVFNSASILPTSNLAFLRDANVGMFESGEMDAVNAAFAEWFESSEDPGKEAIDFLLSEENSSEDKQMLEFLLASSTAMGTIEGLDQSIINQLGHATPENAEFWEDILNSVSVSSSSARTQLLNTLPNITDEKLVSASLLAMKSDFVTPLERTQFLTELSIYTESESEEVKSAAIMSLGQWSAEGYNYVVEDMLANGTEIEKNAALIATSSGKFWSEQIHHQTVSMLSDQSVPEELRMNAFLALSNRPLDDQSYAEVQKFYEQYILPMESQPR